MLLDAQKENITDCRIIDNTIGVVFFQTPQRGSDLVDLLKWMLQSTLPNTYKERNIRSAAIALEGLNRTFLGWPTIKILELASFWHEDSLQPNIQVRCLIFPN